MDHVGRLLQIGVFSRLARISVRMLRHYADHGLLVPARVDPASGYRYYDSAQLRDAERIAGLRDAGFPVAEMAAALACLDDPASGSATLEAQRQRLLRQAEDVAGRLAALDRFVHQHREPTMSIDVRTTTIPAMTIAAARAVIPSYADEHLLWSRLMPPVVAAGLVPSGLSGATFHDDDYRESEVDVEVWTQVPSAFAASDGVECRLVAEQRVVTATLLGSYDAMATVTAALGAYVAAHGLGVGPMFNIYRVSPATDPDPAHWVTEVCLPIIETQGTGVDA